VDPAASAPTAVLGGRSPYLDRSAPLPASDQARAQRLLDEIAADGEPLKFTFTVPASGFFRKTAEYVQSRLTRFRNVSVQVDVVDNATITQRVFVERKFMASVLIVPVSDPEPDLYNLLHGDGLINHMGYRSAAMDKALEQGRSATDEAARRSAYAEMQRLVAADVPIVPYRSQVTYTVHAKSVTGLTLHGEGAALFDRLRIGG
jgi:peptide/nickel transport system substrate-binding protein